MSEFVSILERIRPGYKVGGRAVDIARRRIPYTEETFKKIDQLLKDSKIKTYSDLGRALGLNIPKPTGVRGKKGPGTELSKRSALIKAYEASRGEIPADRFKLGTAYARGQKKVEDVLKLQSKGMSTNAIAQKLKMDRRNVRTIFEKFRPEAIKSPTPKADDPTTTIKTRASRRRQKREAEAFKKVGEKTANQTKKVINTIKDKNAGILKMSNAEILNDPKIRYSMNIDATGLKIGEPIKFNKYADLSDKEFVKKVRDKAKTKTFYTPEHISEVAKEKLNTAFPNNIVNAPGRMTSQIGLIKTYLRNNPTGEFAAQADEVLKKTGMQFKTGGATFGIKENIVFDSKTNKSNIVENYFQDTKPTKPSRIKTAFKSAKPVLKALPVIGTAIGLYDVNKALQAGITDPRDLYMAYEISADTAAKNERMREDPEFRRKEMAGLPAIMTEDEIQQDFTSFRNGGIVAVKGVI
jgi:predicted transcriptional regulator/uncharacterized protein YoaH (UPF0181 family)